MAGSTTRAVVAMIGSNALVGSPAVVGSTAVVLLLNSLCHRAPNFSPHIPHSEEEWGGTFPLLPHIPPPPSWVQPGKMRLGRSNGNWPLHPKMSPSLNILYLGVCLAPICSNAYRKLFYL
jgi:hypothetical protein